MALWPYVYIWWLLAIMQSLFHQIGSIQTQWTEGNDHNEKRKMLIMLAPFWFIIRVLLAHWPSSLARNEGKEQVTTGNRTVLQSITDASERLNAKHSVLSSTVLTDLKLSSCASESHWRGFWQLDPFSCAFPTSDLEDEWEKTMAWGTKKCELEFVWPRSGPFLNTLAHEPKMSKSKILECYIIIVFDFGKSFAAFRFHLFFPVVQWTKRLRIWTKIHRPSSYKFI